MKQLIIIGLLILLLCYFFYSNYVINQQRNILSADNEELICSDSQDNWILEDEIMKYTEAVDEYVNNK